MIGRLVFTAFVLGVTGFVAHGAAQATWHGMGLYAAPAAASAPPRLVVASVPRETDLSPVHTLAPFGRRVVPPPAPVETAPVVPLTPLVAGMRLRGVLVASVPARSVAVIALPGTHAARFAIGESVGTRATLDEIHANRVILSEGDRRETLWMNERDAPAPAIPGGTAMATAPGSAPAAGAGTIRARPAIAGPSGARSVDETIDLYRRRIAINPKAVLDRFGVSVVPEGYRVGASPSEGVVRAGLRTGDIIAEVNGETVGSIENDRRLFERVIAAGFARVKIIRGGQDIVLSFPFR